MLLTLTICPQRRALIDSMQETVNYYNCNKSNVFVLMLVKLLIELITVSYLLWPSRTVLTLYTEACTVVRTDTGLSKSFEFKVGLHQGSVLSRLLFAAVIDAVSSEARNGLPSELLYADDLVRMAPTMEQLGRRVAEWSASLLDKGMNVNPGKYKVMVGSSGGKVIVHFSDLKCTVFD